MFLRRFIKSDVSLGGAKPDSKAPNQGPPHGMQTMGASLQSKFSKGVHYNMKIIIKGDRNVGKTCLHLRLQGQKFREEYLPTDEIQVASIQWSYKTSDDIIKVEVWDIVDKGRKRKKSDSLKLNTSISQLSEETCLDAEFVDVYKGTQGVIMVFDVTKQWTFDYVEKEIPRVPSSVPILVLANHRDMGHHRTVTEEQVQTLVDELQQNREGPIKYAESSMRNGYGLKYIHKFFSLPFLHLQRTTLMIQLEKNSEDIAATMQELDLLESTEDQNYDIFSDTINTKRREQQEKLAQKAIEEARIQQQEQQMQQQMSNQTARSNGGVANSMTKSFSFSANLPPIKEAPAAQPLPSLKLHQNNNMTKSQSTSLDGNFLEREIIPSKSVPSTPCQVQATPIESSTGGSFLGKFLSSAKKHKKQDNNVAAENSCAVSSGGVSKEYTNQASPQPPVKNVDEFRPDVDGIDDNFLDDVADEVAADSKGRSKSSQKEDGQHAADSDEDAQCGNPLVTGYRDDLDSSDEEAYKKFSAAEPKVANRRKFNANSNVKIDLSSSDDDDDIPEVAVTRSILSKSKEIVASSQLKSGEEFNDKENDATTSTAEGEMSRSSPVLHTLNAADFDALEEKYIKQVPKSTSFCADGPLESAHDNDDGGGDKKKKKKLKNKKIENSDDEKDAPCKTSKKKSAGQTKKSKNKTKDYADVPDESSSSGGAKKKKSRNKKQQDDDLENFLRSAPSTYESL